MLLLDHYKWIIGDGLKVNFWTDNWIYDSPLVDILQIPPNLHAYLPATVGEFLQGSTCSIPQILSDMHPSLLADLNNLDLPLLPTAEC